MSAKRRLYFVDHMIKQGALVADKIEVKLDFDAQDVQRQLMRLEEREIPFAMALTATRTAKAAQLALKDEISRVFDNPTPWILNSTYILAAKKSDPKAVVYAREWGGTPAPTTLTPQIEGGERQYKRSEGALRAGGYLPNGWQVAPGPGAKRDKYGNINRGQLQQVLSSLRVQRDVHQNRRQGKPTEFFVIRPGTSNPLQPGVWQRVGRRPSLMRLQRLLMTYLLRRSLASSHAIAAYGRGLVVRGLTWWLRACRCMRFHAPGPLWVLLAKSVECGSFEPRESTS
ncbi:hypothetical protein ACK1QH_004440 [Salmonella enterica]